MRIDPLEITSNAYLKEFPKYTHLDRDSRESHDRAISSHFLNLHTFLGLTRTTCELRALKKTRHFTKFRRSIREDRASLNFWRHKNDFGAEKTDCRLLR